MEIKEFKQHKSLIIKMFKEGNSYTEIAKFLNSDNISRDFQRIKRLVKKELGNVKSPRGYFYKQEIIEEILNLINNGYKPTQIANKLGIPVNALEEWIRRKYPNVSFMPNKGNIHYFETIDSYAKAYIVGFIAADGCVSIINNYKILSINIKYSDRDVLEFIKEEIKFEHEIYTITKPLPYDKSRLNTQAVIRLEDTTLVESLEKLGIKPHKSLKMDNIIPNIPYEYRDAFIIGYFDGDGCCYLPCQKKYKSNEICVQILGTESFLKGIQEHLQLKCSHIRKTHAKIHELTFTNKEDIIRFFKCYENLPFYYKRKYNKFLQRINLPAYDKYK